MSNRERCNLILNDFTEEQLAEVAALLTSAKTLADEAADNAYCARLYADYQADSDKGEPMDVEIFASNLGVAL